MAVTCLLYPTTHHERTVCYNKVKEATKPLTTAVVEGAKVVGEAAKPVTSAIVDGAKVAGAKLHEGAEAAKVRVLVDD